MKNIEISKSSDPTLQDMKDDIGGHFQQSLSDSAKVIISSGRIQESRRNSQGNVSEDVVEQKGDEGTCSNRNAASGTPADEDLPTSFPQRVSR